MPSQCERFTQSNIAKLVSQAMNKILEALLLMYISFNACAEENTIEGFWASSGVIIEVKVLGSFGQYVLSLNWQPNYYDTVIDIQSVIFFHQLSKLKVIKTELDWVSN